MVGTLSTMVIYLFLWGILFVTSWSKDVMAGVEAAVLGQGRFGQSVPLAGGLERRTLRVLRTVQALPAACLPPMLDVKGRGQFCLLTGTLVILCDLNFCCFLLRHQNFRKESQIPGSRGTRPCRTVLAAFGEGKAVA